MPRKARFRRGLVLVPVVLVAGTVAGLGSSGATPGPRRGVAHVRQAAAAPVVDVVSEATPNALPTSRPALGGTVGLAATAYLGRARTVLQIPVFTAAVYILPADRPAEPQRVASYALPAHPKPGCDYYQSAPLLTSLWAAHIEQPDPTVGGKVSKIGVLPDVPVSLLAFGSIPVTATLHLRQAVVGGRVVPIYADQLNGQVKAVSAGRPYDSDEPSCDPQWENEGSPPKVTAIRGELSVTVSDVAIDGRRLDVGATCATKSALRLKAFGDADYGIVDGGTILQRRDATTVAAAGNTYSRYPGSSNLVVPSFVNCRSPLDGQDYSRLLTSLVSGTDNSLAISQSKALFNNDFPAYQPILCNDSAACVGLPDNPAPVAPGS